MRSKKIDWFKSLPFIFLHIASVVGVIWVPVSVPLLALCIGSYYLRMFAITAGYHRYFAHRSYKMSRTMQFAIAWLGSTAIQKGVLWWAAHHRSHHKYSDQENDIHSPVRNGFWWSHVGWILSTAYDETDWGQIQDLAKYPELRWLNRYHAVPGLFYAAALFALGGWSWLTWGFVISTVLLWHGTFSINSLSHVFGTVRYQTQDASRNNFWLALITLGEGWHNNHHCYMSSTKQGFYWWELDGSYVILKGLSWVGLVSNLRKPPLHLLENKRLQTKNRNLKSDAFNVTGRKAHV